MGVVWNLVGILDPTNNNHFVGTEIVSLERLLKVKIRQLDCSGPVILKEKWASFQCFPRQKPITTV